MKNFMKVKYIVATIKNEHITESHRAHTEGECIAWIEKTPADLGKVEYTIMKIYEGCEGRIAVSA